MDMRRCVDYFMIDEKKYYTGTVFKTKHYGDAVFVCTYYPEHMKGAHIVYKVMSTGGERWTPIDMFKNEVMCITGAVDNATEMPRQKRMRDRDIDGMALGWLWYIFLMAISTIFKDAIGLWILISVVFFSWRANKIQKEGTYIEW